jgi:hypothetical protein
VDHESTSQELTGCHGAAARAVLAWRYEDIYAFYNADPHDLHDGLREMLDGSYYAATDNQGTLTRRPTTRARSWASSVLARPHRSLAAISMVSTPQTLWTSAWA